MSIESVAGTFHLTKEEVNKFHETGFLGPYTLCSHVEMAEIRQYVEENVILLKDKTPQSQHNRHKNSRKIYDLCTHPAILDRMESIMGKSLVLWRSHFFIKYPGGKEIPWHQDANYWPIEPPLNISAWIAIDEATIENSCVQLIPGSHRKVVSHIPTDDTKEFRQEADPKLVNASLAVPMELKPGEFFLFNERTLHYSAANTSDKRRIGLSIRVTVPTVKVFPQQGDHEVFLVRGEDLMGLNQLGEPPQN